MHCGLWMMKSRVIHAANRSLKYFGLQTLVKWKFPLAKTENSTAAKTQKTIGEKWSFYWKKLKENFKKLKFWVVNSNFFKLKKILRVSHLNFSEKYSNLTESGKAPVPRYRPREKSKEKNNGKNEKWHHLRTTLSPGPGITLHSFIWLNNSRTWRECSFASLATRRYLSINKSTYKSRRQLCWISPQTKTLLPVCSEREIRWWLDHSKFTAFSSSAVARYCQYNRIKIACPPRGTVSELLSVTIV